MVNSMNCTPTNAIPTGDVVNYEYAIPSYIEPNAINYIVLIQNIMQFIIRPPNTPNGMYMYVMLYDNKLYTDYYYKYNIIPLYHMHID